MLNFIFEQLDLGQVLQDNSSYLNPIPAEEGGVNLTPPPVFLHNSKSIGLRLLTYSDFS